jgi:hypothetical protein
MTATLLLIALSAAADPPAGFPKFETQEIAKDLKIGYAVVSADVNGDKKPDIVVVDKERVVWYENPTWKMMTIITGKTKPDNVCIAPADIDGDGQIDFVLGAGWRPTDTTTPGTLQWLGRGKTLDDEWTVHPIPCDEPTVHRVQVADLDGSGKPQIIMAPLQGRGATAKGNWTDGRPVRIVSYAIPKEPRKTESWKAVVLNEDLRVVHNFTPGPDGKELLAVSYEGVHLISWLHREGTKQTWTRAKLNDANQANPKGSRGASEIATVALPTGHGIATVEPWHGNQIVYYGRLGEQRTVVDDHLRWGHAIKFADMNGDKKPLIVAGVRDNPNPKQGDTFTEKCGVRLYRNTDGKGEKWDRMLLDEGGVAVEDLTVADLNGDGKPDIVAVGRATGNCRIYWNKGGVK